MPRARRVEAAAAAAAFERRQRENTIAKMDPRFAQRETDRYSAAAAAAPAILILPIGCVPEKG